MPDQPQGTAAGSRLYLSASGSIGQTMTATSWRSCHYWRLYKFPSKNPTPSQQRIRDFYKAQNEAWKTGFKQKYIRDDWNRAASYASEKMSGYNRFVSAAMDAQLANPHTAFVSGYEQTMNGMLVNFAGLDGKPFEMYDQYCQWHMGYNPWSQTLRGTVTFGEYGTLLPKFPGPGTYYLTFFVNGVPASGLIRVKFGGY